MTSFSVGEFQELPEENYDRTRLEYFQKRGSMVPVSGTAILSGCEYETIDGTNYGYYHVGKKTGNLVGAINAHGKFYYELKANKILGIRPFRKYNSIEELRANYSDIEKTPDNLERVFEGYYLGDPVSHPLQEELTTLKNTGELQKINVTLNFIPRRWNEVDNKDAYGETEIFVKDYNVYVQIPANTNRKVFKLLSGNHIYQNGDMIWVSIKPYYSTIIPELSGTLFDEIVLGHIPDNKRKEYLQKRFNKDVAVLTKIAFALEKAKAEDEKRKEEEAFMQEIMKVCQIFNR